MAFTVDVLEDGTPRYWTLDPDGGASAHTAPDYQPAIYAAARGDQAGPLDWLADALADDPKVAGVDDVQRYRSLRADEPSPMARIRLHRLGEVRQLARELRRREHEAYAPGTIELYDVDLDPAFRFVLDRGLDPTPDREVETLALALPDPAVADSDVGPLAIDGEPAVEQSDPAPEAVADAVDDVLDARDPDVLLLSTAEIVPLLADAGVDLGRAPGYRKLAGESTYVSYGQVGHSPARYDVPGRALIDRSSSFLLGHSSLAGVLYFVERAQKPLQAVAKDSIGGVLTAIEVREARQWIPGEGSVADDDGAADGGASGAGAAAAGDDPAYPGVPAPWQKRQTEDWKSLDTLHDADRGGFTFQPEAGASASGASGGSARAKRRDGVHEDVHQLDFASLYPNIIREYGVSPDTVCCDCHDRADVPELGYSVCVPDEAAGDRPEGDDGPPEDHAFLARVLGPLLDDRADRKAELREADPGDDTAETEAVVEAIKWVLVSCFGYQGYRHAKFGRIETHEAINAHARQLMLDAKDRLEAAGWRVVHGIVDSLWVTPAPDREQQAVREVAGEISEAAGIDLEYEGRFEWIAFCPRKRASGAALMRYFGRWADAKLGEDPDPADKYKLRGIEARQRSTTAFVADAQRDLLATFDRERAPEPVCDHLERHLRTLRGGEIDPDDLAITQRVSKPAAGYQQATRAKAALERATEVGVPRSPGQDVEYVVVDDELAGPRRVRLAFEDVGEYDADFYADRLVRACESLLAPLGWSEGRIRGYLTSDRDAALSAFGGG